jgi:hypothetical protein
MNLREILPSRIRMLPEFMDGGEIPYHPTRGHFPVDSYRTRKSYSPDDLEKIKQGICPRCGSSLCEEMVIACGDKCTQVWCRSCARRYYPVLGKEERFDFRKCHDTPKATNKKIWRDFHCKECGKHRAGMFVACQKFCPGSDCAKKYWKRDTRESYRRRNNLTRYLGK